MLLVSQYLTQGLVSPPQNDADESQKNTLLILKFLPVMIAWFSLNVPAGLGIYWFTNNIVTTGIQVYLKQGGGAAVAIPDPQDLELKAGTAKRSSSEDRDAREQVRVAEQEARRARFAEKRESEQASAKVRAAERSAAEGARKEERARQAAAAQKAKEALEAANAAAAANGEVVQAEVSEVSETEASTATEAGADGDQPLAAEAAVAEAETVTAAAAAAPAKQPRKRARRKRSKK